MPTALIDGDVIGYIAAAQAQHSEGWDEADKIPTYAPQDVDRAIETLLDEWTSKAGCADRKVFVTGRANFRYQVDPTYKSNRVNSRRPVALDYAKAYLRERAGAVEVNGLEADDLIGLSLTGSYSDGRGVAVSIDKDMRTLPGHHLNPNKDLAPVEVSTFEADYFWMYQTLVGDQTDGYPGLPGVGPKRAEAILMGKLDQAAMWAAIVAAYATKKLTTAHALTQARLARILRKGGYDKATREVILWHPDPKNSTRLPLPSTPSEPASDQQEQPSQ